MYNKNLLKDSFFDDINGMSLDNYQRKIILNNNKSLLVVAGAGSGKTLTIIGKIKYLIEKRGMLPRDILCISFTNETVNNLIKKVGYDINCYTFHKLAINIIYSSNMKVNIESSGLLEYIVDEYFDNDIISDGLTSGVIYYFLEKDIIISYKEFCIKFRSELNIYKNSVISFIKKIKTYNHNVDDIRSYVNSLNDNEKVFLIIVLRIYSIYQEELISTNSVDFDDMISLATILVNKNKFKKKYKYIIIDEYQDTSMIRYNLIKSIVDRCNSRVMCVGDDYQSIYKFSGCSLDLFVNFKKYFDDSKIMFIKNTYRNSYHVINTSIGFVMKNPYQLKKRLYAKFLLKNPIKIVYYNESNYSEMFYLSLSYLYNMGYREVLVLGRYNDDYKYVVKDEMNNNFISYLDMSVRFMSVHSSKGLESENVIILNMTDKYKGFPSKISDMDIFRVFDNKEKFLYAEERRLFYVALTRTKKNIIIMADINNPSCFISEIKSKIVEIKF